MSLPPLHVQGMHGLGDCLHQRAVMRQLMQRYDVVLETSWPSMYHDLIAQGLKVTRRPVALRTQTKNAARESESALFSPRHPLLRAGLQIRYTGQQVLATPSKTILEAMCNGTGTDFATADFRLPLPDAWTMALWQNLGHLGRRAQALPWMLFRPLTVRPEWRGGMARNADETAYMEVFNSLRSKFFVISVADLEPGKEWLTGPELASDLAFHSGQLVFEDLAALAKACDLVFTSSGFAAILGPAVETPTISIIGGYEDVRCHDAGKKFAPMLSIGPERPCSCWRSNCGRVCDKSINMETAKAAVAQFVAENVKCPTSV